MAFPQELKRKPQWVCWRLVPDKDGKERKLPLNPRTMKSAASNQPDSWTDYETALAAQHQYQCSGLGYVFQKADGIVGVDVDHCYDPETGTFNAVAADLLALQPTYGEFSPSGTGIHLYYHGVKLGSASKNTQTGVEMYDNGRYFTVTERQIPGTPDQIAEGGQALQLIYETYLVRKKSAAKPPTPARAKGSLNDDVLLEKAMKSSRGELFRQLWEGQWSTQYKSHSEADLAFCCMLAFWSGRAPEQMDRLFRRSGLYRAKWDEKHHSGGKTYGAETISRACATTQEVYQAASSAPIIERDGQYYRVKGDNTYPLTNFIIVPTEMIFSQEETQLTADLISTQRETFHLNFMATDFSNQQRFKNLLNRNTISLSFYGTDGDLELLKNHISKLPWTKKHGVSAMGIHFQGNTPVFVTPEGGIAASGQSVPALVQLEKYSCIPSGIAQCSHLPTKELLALGQILFSYNEPAKTVSILSWAAACFVKEHLRLSGIKFPHLFLIGEAGSGKSTTLEHVLLPLFSCSKVTAAPQVTPFTLMKEASSSNTIPVCLDEFKPSKLDRLRLNALYNHFRDSYDGHEGIRGRIDQTVVSYPLLAPIIVAGEESAEETAIRERTIELLFSKKDLKQPEHRQVFSRLLRAGPALSRLGKALLDVALSLTPEQVARWHLDADESFSVDLPPRVANNLCCCVVGLRLLEQLCLKYRRGFSTVFPYEFDRCTQYLEAAARNYLLDGGTYNQSVVDQTFEIMSRMELNPSTDFSLDTEKKILSIRLNYVYDLYTKYRKDYAIVGEVLTYAQFRKQLMYSDVFLRANVQKWMGGENRKVWEINYEILSKRCDVSGFSR